jgi:head-tail adaptor
VRLPHTVKVLRAPLISDGKGNQIRDWAHASSRTYAAWVQPVSSDEQTLNEQRVVSRWRLFAEPSADIAATDRISWAGKTFQVDGEVQAWDVGYVHHFEGYLRLVTG